MTAKIRVAHYTPEHFSRIKLKEVMAKDLGEISTCNGSVTFLVDDEPVAIFGGFFISQGVFQVWSLMSESVRKYPLAFHKSVKEMIDHWFERLNMTRMQMSVRVDHVEGARWAELLGFSCEGTMKKYGPTGDDHKLFARVK